MGFLSCLFGPSASEIAQAAEKIAKQQAEKQERVTRDQQRVNHLVEIYGERHRKIISLMVTDWEYDSNMENATHDFFYSLNRDLREGSRHNYDHAKF